MLQTAAVTPYREPCSAPVARFHSFTSPAPPQAPLPDASVLPSGDMAKHHTASECPVRVNCSRPVRRSQTLTVLSKAPEASELPFGAKAKHKRRSLWPRNVTHSFCSGMAFPRVIQHLPCARVPSTLDRLHSARLL